MAVLAQGQVLLVMCTGAARAWTSLNDLGLQRQGSDTRRDGLELHSTCIVPIPLLERIRIASGVKLARESIH